MDLGWLRLPTVHMAAYKRCNLRLVAFYCHRQIYKTDTTWVGPATNYQMLVLQVLLVGWTKNNA